MLVQILNRKKIGLGEVAISAKLRLECQAKCLMIEETGVPGENHRPTSSDTELTNVHSRVVFEPDTFGNDERQQAVSCSTLDFSAIGVGSAPMTLS